MPQWAHSTLWVIDKGTHFDISACFVRHLHDKLTVRDAFAKVIQNVQIHTCAEVVDVGYEEVLFPGLEVLGKQARSVERGIHIPVTRGVPWGPARVLHETTRTSEASVPGEA